MIERLTVAEVKDRAFDALADDDGEVTLPASVVLDLLHGFMCNASDISEDQELGA